MSTSAPDYVIIGAGSSGSTLAGRLSEDPDVQVLLLEAGGKDSSINVKIPAAFPNQFHTKLDWDYETEPEPGCDGRRLYVPRGKMLGGSSSMNAMLYVRGRPIDYDMWVEAGATGWGWDDVLPYFLKSEDNQRGASEFHAVGGPLTISEQRSPRPLCRELLAASEAAGLPRINDYNGPEQDGVSMFQVHQRNGRRWSAADAFLKPAMKRPNLTVVTGAQVLGLIVEGDAVTGVRYKRGRKEESVRPARETILCAGALNSPQILMVSGIGPAAGLESVGVKVLHDLEGVGQNLQDHPFLTMNYEVRDSDTLYGATHPKFLAEWALRKSGKLTSTAAEVCGFWRSRAGLPAADIQFHMGGLYFEKHGSEELDAHAAVVAPTLVAPKSRGEVTLRSADPLAKPKILTNSLTEPEDVAAMLAGMRKAREIVAAEPLASKIVREVLPGPGYGDDDLETALRERVELIYHPTSTCAIGSVVDPELRVRGLTGIRVVDASVFPVIPGGNTNAPAIMVAERAADLIRGRVPVPA